MPYHRVWVAVLVLAVAPSALPAQQLVNAYPNLSFQQPLLLTNCGDGTDRVFVVQQTGIIDVFPNDSAVASAGTFLDISAKLSSSSGEEGLLGLAFDPNYSQNGYFFVNYTAPSPLRTVVARYSVLQTDSNRADPTSEFKIIEIPQPYTNHNGGMLAFGPDGYLYIGMGDGGSGGDPQNNAQDRTKLLGKMLRIDVHDTTATTHYTIPPDNPYVNDITGLKKEIFAYGLRNPWRFSFDPLTGVLWAADVGQDSLEEIDIIEKGKNYGWRIMEGTNCYNPPSGCDTTGLTMPIKEYHHPIGEAIIGGYVYHGYRRPDLTGAYIYGDLITHKIWMLKYQNGTITADSLVTQTTDNISSFGVDRHNELYVVTHSTSAMTGIYRFAGNPLTGVGQRTDVGLPTAFSLKQNYPNPFNPTTRIGYSIASTSHVSLVVFDVLGRSVATLVNGVVQPGNYEITFDARTLPSGVYLYRIQASNYTAWRKLLLLK